MSEPAAAVAPCRDAVRARVIVIAGPSGSGKSRLCHRLEAEFGVPVVNLDDFYKNGDDPTLPRLEIAPGQDMVDWDDPRLLVLRGRARRPRTALPRRCRRHPGLRHLP